MKQSWTSFGKKFADFRYVLMKFLFFIVKLPSMCQIRIYFVVNILCFMSDFWRSFFYQIHRKYEENHALYDGSPHYWISQWTWRDFFYGERCLLEIFYQLSTNNCRFLIDPCQNFNIQGKFLNFLHYAATNCCILSHLLKFCGILFFTFYGRR